MVKQGLPLGEKNLPEAVSAPQSFEQQMEVLIRARYPLLAVETFEEFRLEKIVARIVQRRKCRFYTWSHTRGLVPAGTPITTKTQEAQTRDPIGVLDAVIERVEPAIYLLKDFHAFLRDPTVVRKVREVGQALKNSYKTVVFVSPQFPLPVELEKEVVLLRLPLPSQSELELLLVDMVKSVEGKIPNLNLSPEDRSAIAQAALGLTWDEAENVFAKILVACNRISRQEVDIVVEEKGQVIRKSGVLEYYPAKEDFRQVGGLENLKSWLKKRQLAFSPEASEFGLPHPRGVLIIGVPGCGKSLCAKATATLWRVPLLRLDMSRIFSSLVGSSEANMRQALQVAESVAPAVLWVDEIEKAFAGVTASGHSDAGTTQRVFGLFLTWLQEKSSSVFVIATANEIESLPPELLRKGRFDEIFFVDLPHTKEREQIFAIHLKKRKRDPQKFAVSHFAEITEGFNGAEIEQCVVSALFDAFSQRQDLTNEDVIRAIQQTVPLSRTMAEKVEALRRWAQGRARLASMVDVPQTFVAQRKLEV